MPCGGSSCSTATEYCCLGTSPDGGSAETCAAYNGGTCASGALHVGCNEAADCASGVCCQQIIGIGVQGSTSCAPSCTYTGASSQSFQTCRSDSECGADSDAGAAKKCILQACGGGAGPGSAAPLTVEACAVYTAGTLGRPGTWGPLPYCAAK